MRELTTHKTNPANKELTVEVKDEQGSGGACHLYEVHGFNGNTNMSAPYPDLKGCTILFQNGPIGEVGVNGVTHEALLAILIDRMQCFQKGAYSCRENSLALTKLEEAMHWLQHRTRARELRGVEGTHTV